MNNQAFRLIEKIKKIRPNRIYLLRIFFSVIGVLMAGLGIGFLKRASFGVDPFQVLAGGIDAIIPLPFGTVYLIIGVTLLVFTIIADKHFIGIGTIVTMLFQGYFIDFIRSKLFELFPDLSISGRIIFFIIGMAILCIATSIYFCSDLGVSAYDSISLIVANTWKINTLGKCRMVTDILCVIIGSILYLLTGNTIHTVTSLCGVGTVVLSFFMGPIVEKINNLIVRLLTAKSEFKNPQI